MPVVSGSINADLVFRLARTLRPERGGAEAPTAVGVLAAAPEGGLDLPAAMSRAVAAASLACGRGGGQRSLPHSVETDRACAAEAPNAPGHAQPPTSPTGRSAP